MDLEKKLFLYLVKKFAKDDYFLGAYLAYQELPDFEKIAAQSEEGKKALKFWFNIQTKVDWNISMIASAYYDRHHPKHYLWLGHNRYLYDRILPGDRVLDIGCGNSYYQQWIAEKAAEVVGVDIREDRVALARRNNQKTNVHYELMDVTRDLPEGRFDVVICSHVLEHLDDPVEFLSKIATKIPRLLVKVPLVDSHWMKRVRKDIGMFLMDDADHRREYSEELLNEHLINSGWILSEMIRGYDLRAMAYSKHFDK